VALERKLNDRLGRICFYHDHQNGPKYLEQARRLHLQYGLLWIIAPLSRVVGAPVAVVLAVCLTVILDSLRLRKHPMRNALAHLVDSFAATTYLANCYTYSGRLALALESSSKLLPLVYSHHKLPRAGYLLSRVYALVLMNRFDEAMAGTEEALRILDKDRRSPISAHDRVHAIGGALITRVWVDLTRGHVSDSQCLQRFDAFVSEHPTALLTSWLLEVQLFAAYRRGNLAETREAWSRLVQKSAQAEVQFVQSKARVWLALACLDSGHTSEAQDIADDVVAVARSKSNPTLLALGLELRALSLRAWEQLDEAARCFDEAAALLLAPDVCATELYHSILLCQASLALDQGDSTRARTLALQVAEANRGLVLSHDLHRLRVARILGRAAVVEGRPLAGISDLALALSIAEALGDKLECAYSWHSLAQAQAASDGEAAVASRLACERILLDLGNNYQLRRLGFRGPEEPISQTSSRGLNRVRQLVRDSLPNEPCADPCAAPEPGGDGLSPSPRDETMPAIDSLDERNSSKRED
jgi:tetratricopeptide (TPR) repeat protein